jgi:hypothetical protein
MPSKDAHGQLPSLLCAAGYCTRSRQRVELSATAGRPLTLLGISPQIAELEYPNSRCLGALTTILTVRGAARILGIGRTPTEPRRRSCSRSPIRTPRLRARRTSAHSRVECVLMESSSAWLRSRTASLGMWHEGTRGAHPMLTTLVVQPGSARSVRRGWRNPMRIQPAV